MARFKPCLAQKATLNSVPIHAGQFIVCSDTGEIFVDISNIWRKQCSSKLQNIYVNNVLQEIDTNGQVNIEVPIRHKSTANWEKEQDTFIPAAGQIIIYDDADIINGISYANVKLGNGVLTLRKLPFITDPMKSLITDHINDTVRHITAEERTDWNAKISCRLDGDSLVFFE